MKREILDFIENHNVCSLTTTLLDGSPHASAVHFSHDENPLNLYFMTENTTKKCQAMLDGHSVMASVVVGLSEEEWITLQMDGHAQAILDNSELESVQRSYFAKHPKAEQYKSDPETIFIKFIPKWWRYTDFNTKPITIISSEN